MTDHFKEAESYLQKLDTLEPADAYVAVVAAQAHAQLAQIGPARDMVGLQRQLLASMLPTAPTKADQVKAAIQEAQALARAMPGTDEQVKPAVAEPTEFGSLVRAGRGGSDRVLWHPTTFHGKHYWMSETGVVEVWSELTDVEVLRVGLGEPESVATQISRMSRFAHEANKDAFDAGFDACRAGAHQKLCALLADAITSERKNAYEKAIQAVEELAP